MADPLASLALLARSLRGPFNFLHPTAEEVYRLFPDLAAALPAPQRIYLADETATPVVGFPVLASEGLRALQLGLADYLRAEEEFHVRIALRQSHDAHLHQVTWERYRSLLARVTENVITSSYGRQFPNVFWLHHSFEVARSLKETPRRVMRLDAGVGREQGAAIKYQVFHRYLDRVLNLTYDIANRVAADTEEVEQELFPALLARMRDNVLVLTEDHISPDLAELGPYFQAVLRLDFRDLRFRLAKLATWTGEVLRADAVLRETVRQLLKEDPDGDPRELFRHPGVIATLTRHPRYPADSLLGPDHAQVWERLLMKLKEFELLHGLRKVMVPLQKQADGRLVFRERSLNRTWIGPSVTEVSAATRPLDFLQPWVVDPQVARYGMIYDVTDFSQTVTMLRRAGSELQDRSFRMMFRFQRKVNRLAASYRLKLEKYLGDGAFYSGREAWRLLTVAVQVQRFYAQALKEGFPFNRGMRIALNFGHYRLLPIQAGTPGVERYEFFGHGVVELTRLTTGKSMREIEEIKILLVNRGYSEAEVHRFFAPLAHKDSDVVDKREEQRSFHAYINSNGKLVNEGIVATEQFVAHLSGEPRFSRLYRVSDEARSYVVVPLDTPEGRLYVGLRKLGVASLKGLDPMAVFEVVDGARWSGDGLQEIADGARLITELERDYAAGLTAAS